MRRRVVFAVEAQADLDDIFAWVADHAGVATALAYTRRIHDHCLALATFPERGARRDDIAEGLRTAAYRRRVTIAFTVEPDRVVVLRLLHAGRDVAAILGAKS
jgi:toxin ParE1/3/4